ncbi:MAG: hypothetical protein R3E66_22900 [bacterium]
MKKILLPLACVFAACSGGTPAGQTVLAHSFEPAAAEAVTKSLVLSAEPPTQLDVQIVSIQDAQGMRLANVALTVVQSGGWTVSAAPPGNPINVGTVEAPVMEVPILVSRERTDACATRASTQMIKVRADGTVAAD